MPMLSQAGNSGEFQGKIGIYAVPDSKTTIDLDALAISSGGYGYGVTAELGKGLVFAFLDYGVADQDGSKYDYDLTLTDTRIGLGLRSPGDANVLVLRVESRDIDMEIEASGSKESGDISGTGAHIGIESAMSDSAMFYASAGYLDIEEYDGPEFRMGVSGLLAEKVRLYGELRTLHLSDGINDLEIQTDDLQLGVSYQF